MEEHFTRVHQSQDAALQRKALRGGANPTLFEALDTCSGIRGDSNQETALGAMAAAEAKAAAVIFVGPADIAVTGSTTASKLSTPSSEKTTETDAVPAAARPSTRKRERKLVGEVPNHCRNCGKAFASHYKLERHLTAHKNQRDFSCRRCRRTFVQRATCTRHEKRFPGSHFSCPLNTCNKVYDTSAERDVHAKTCSRRAHHKQLQKSAQLAAVALAS